MRLHYANADIVVYLGLTHFDEEWYNDWLSMLIAREKM